MCGIAGIIKKTGESVHKSEIAPITRMVRHRGPDDEGFYFGAGFAFGHRRLIIQDLSSAGHQPMVMDDGENVLVYNGEVYNFLELRAELQSLGRVFNSHCDTEVVLQAYKEWGEDCVNRFNGMWAFALFDAKRNCVFCSRDRFGIKPFYYVDLPNRFVFGSEIKQLVDSLSKRSANRDLLQNFILTAITDHTEQTFFTDVVKLPAGHNLLYDLSRHTFRLTRYYTIPKNGDFAEIRPEEAVAQYRERFESSIALRLRSDVRVGTCLSGGLDSSSVATLAALQYGRECENPFAAITAVSTQASNDESSYAQAVVNHSGLEWFPVTPSYKDFQRVIDEVVTIQEEPFCGPSLVMQYFVMQTAKNNGITVLLDGQGGDETLLGYPKYYASHLIHTLKVAGAVNAVSAVNDILRADTNMSISRLLMYLAGGVSASARYKYYLWKHRYLQSPPELPEHLKQYSSACHDVFALQKLENISTNLPVLLRYEDRNSMAHSIETRLPFLDYKLFEFSLSLAGKMKINDGWSKWVLREAMKNDMLDEITWRRDKRGFEAPEEQWLPQHDECMKKAVFNSAILARLCNGTRLQSLYPGLDTRSRWRLYSIARWEQMYSVEL